MKIKVVRCATPCCW